MESPTLTLQEEHRRGARPLSKAKREAGSTRYSCLKLHLLWEPARDKLNLGDSDGQAPKLAFPGFICHCGF